MDRNPAILVQDRIESGCRSWRLCSAVEVWALRNVPSLFGLGGGVGGGKRLSRRDEERERDQVLIAHASVKGVFSGLLYISFIQSFRSSGLHRPVSSDKFETCSSKGNCVVKMQSH